MEYKPNSRFSLFLSPLTSRLTLVANDSLAFYGKYGVHPGSRSLEQLGAFLTTILNARLSSQISYQGRLDLFSNYLHQPQNIDLYLTNLLSLKVSKYLATTLSLNMIYDNNITFLNAQGGMSPRMQVQELIGIGFSYQLN
ncbi:MAG: hypothetical protein ACYCOO_03010 [Chitinophagaceae bacterium]